MKIKTYQQWLDVFAQETLPQSRRLFQFGNLDLDLTEDQARELYKSIVDSEAEPEPQRPRCKIMRRIGPYDGTPLGCYSTVAYCDCYEAFEELLRAGKLEHGLICIQEQAKEEAAFSPPGSRQYKIVTPKEWNEYCAKTAAPSNETAPAPDPS